MLISNVAATKGVAFGPIIGDWSLILDGAFICFPLTYVIGDVLSEVYGFKAARRAIVIGFAMALPGALMFWLAIELPPLDAGYQAHFEASSACSRACSSPGWPVHRRADPQRLGGGADQGAHQGEASVGPADRVDGRRRVRRHAGVLQHRRGAIGISTWRDFVTYSALGWIYKTAVEVVVLPVTYRVIAYIKRHEPTYRPAV